MLSMKRVLKIIAFVLLISGAFLSYTYHNIKSNDMIQKTLTVPDVEIAESASFRDADGKSDKQIYYLMGSGLIQQNIESFCRDADIQCWSRFLEQNIRADSGSTLIFATSRPLDYMSFERLDELVGCGVNVIFAAGVPQDSILWPMMGILKSGGRSAPARFSFEPDFLPLMEKEMFCPDYSLSSMIYTLPDIHCMVMDARAGAPVVYNRTKGQSVITVFNTTLLEDIGNIGLFAGALAYSEENFIYPVIGNACIFLDNIPMGTPLGDDVLPVRGQNTSRFIIDRVWPVFAQGSLRTKIPYTISIPAVDVRNQSFTFRQRDFLLSFGTEVLKLSGEISMGGRFGREESLIFNDEFELELSIRLPEYTMSSMEELSGIMSDGKRNLIKEYYPQLRVIRRPLYDLDGNYNFESYTDRNGVVAVPVYSGGIGRKGSWFWDAAMSVSGRGCLFHRLDLGEIADFRHGTVGWEENMKDLEDFWKRGPEAADWLNPVTLTTGINEIRGYEAAAYDIRREENQLILLPEIWMPGQKFYLRTDRKIRDCTGGSIRKISESYYLLEVKEEQVIITFQK